MSYSGLLPNKCDVVQPIFNLITSAKTGELVTAGVKCRWMWGLKRIVTAQGETIDSIAKVFFLVAATIDTQYFLHYEGADYKVIKIIKVLLVTQ